jgi:glycosyltransferase involved in cell wall biosynthesis
VRITAVVCDDERALASVRAQEPDELLVVPACDGAARAHALQAAGGDVVAWCDAGEVWAPGRLAALAGELERRPEVDLVYGDVQVAGGRVQRAEDHDFFRLSWWGVTPRAGQVVHRVDAARAAGGFDPALRRHADWDLWLRMSRRGLLRRVPQVVGRRTEVEEDPAWEEWSRVIERHHAELAREGPAALHDLVVDAARPAAFDSDTWREGRRELVVCATPLPRTGYGEVARALLHALPDAGVTPLLAPTRAQLDGELRPFDRDLGHWGRWGFYYHVISRPGALPCARRAVYTMWESSSVPAWRIEELNAAAEVVFVPCTQNADAFVASGLERPVRVLHHGVEAARFGPLERPASRPFTFGTLGDLTLRKGVDVLVRAFRDEFGAREDVALLLHTTSGTLAADGLDDPRIRVLDGPTDHAGLLGTLRAMDAFVLPSRGEGFGLCGLEAAATGLPLIATDWAGPAEYVRDVDGLPLRFELQDAGGAHVSHSVFDGAWAEPDIGHLRALMRMLVADRDAACERGRRAAAAVRARWGWERPAKQLRAELDARTAA